MKDVIKSFEMCRRYMRYKAAQLNHLNMIQHFKDCKHKDVKVTVSESAEYSRPDEPMTAGMMNDEFYLDATVREGEQYVTMPYTVAREKYGLVDERETHLPQSEPGLYELTEDDARFAAEPVWYCGDLVCDGNAKWVSHKAMRWIDFVAENKGAYAFEDFMRYKPDDWVVIVTALGHGGEFHLSYDCAVAEAEEYKKTITK